jgi:CxxC motif-containing protein
MVEELLCSYRRGADQAGIYLIHGNPPKLRIEYHKVDIMDPELKIIKTVRIEEAELNEKPLRLDKVCMEEKPKLMKLFEDVISGKYPRPDQVRNLIALSKDGTSVITEVIMKFCREQVCLCPLWYVGGCLEFCPYPIQGISYFYEPVPLHLKKPFQLLFSALRQVSTMDEFREIMDKLKARMEIETLFSYPSGE